MKNWTPSLHKDFAERLAITPSRCGDGFRSFLLDFQFTELFSSYLLVNMSNFKSHAKEPLQVEQQLVAEHDACGVGLIYRPLSSHQVIACALEALSRMEHRGACGADRDTGDGAGILTDIPWAILESEGWRRSEIGAVGVLYFPKGSEAVCQKAVETVLKEERLSVLGWRTVPTKPDVLGPLAASTCPSIKQILIAKTNSEDDSNWEQRLMIARKRAINQIRTNRDLEDLYIASLSSKTIVYKGLVRSQVLPLFYRDLQNPLFTAHFAVFHRRFSTNTFPRWALAQPFRMLGHNGEINTLLGNRSWMRAREPVLQQPAWSGREHDQQPVMYENGSDSGNLDNAMEMIVLAGHSPEAALMQLMPEAYRHQPALEDHPEIVSFYDYYSALQEPWDGPALIVYSDGCTAGAILDRNGLRPARYTIYKDGSLIISSETGVCDIDAEVLEKGRLGPGQMLVVDLDDGEIHKNWQVKERVARAHPYAQWLSDERKTLNRQQFQAEKNLSAQQLVRNQIAFGYGKEDVKQIINVMAQSGNEPIFSMGDDTPIAVLSQKPRVLFDYFKQRFAQVTNPPIDPLREKLVMSLDTHLGRRTNLLRPAAHAAGTLHLQSPVLNEAELASLSSMPERYPSLTLSLSYDHLCGGLDEALNKLCQDAFEAVRGGCNILILSDRNQEKIANQIPILMAVGAVHHHLIRQGSRLCCSIVADTGQCWTTHHFACLLGYGAQAICPYLALESVRDWYYSDKTQALVKAALHSGGGEVDQTIAPFVGLSAQKAQLNYVKAVEDGILKIISKMGISSLMSYIGAQIFESLGLGKDVVRRCFEGTASRIGGMEIADIERENKRFYTQAFKTAALNNDGYMKHASGGEFHGNNPELVRALHQGLKLIGKAETNEKNQQESFEKYSSLIKERTPYSLRDLLEFQSDRFPIALSEVEPATDIVQRFCTGGMSLGALSKEAHEVLAIAMNRLNAKSNSGEGGEDANRFYPLKTVDQDGTSPDFPGLRNLRPGDSAASAIRQVASARFGVTPEYLATAKQLEIKIAQGAKPGEGGQLPAHKVSPYIAQLRRAKPGMSLISPAPHHDIYSIEDLAQLIFDLRTVNRKAAISVKLVSQIGIGTVAAGVAKANADIIQISGHDGGTGASPLGSIKSAGMPWELGLAETHQVLLANSLRERVILRVDGGIRSGWEVVLAAMLGAEEYSFASIALVAAGCIMARVCHTNNCPIGITSQKEALRRKFPGTPEPVVEFFLFIAEEIRLSLAQLGYKSLAEIIGRNDLLKRRDVALSKSAALNLDLLLNRPNRSTSALALQKEANDHAEMKKSLETQIMSIDDRLLEIDQLRQSIEEHGQFSATSTICNTDRTVGAGISGTIALRHGDFGFNGKIELNFKGSAGQSFGAFNIQNLHLKLSGESNDYVGKGMSGGEIVIEPAENATFNSWENVIIGNTCLYGATGGRLFAAGQAGERFAIRNSGAVAVVEGAGDHCCEYMTGGIVVVLGRVGRNFAAGMTGGLAYVFDEYGEVPALFNGDEGKHLQRMTDSAAESTRQLIEMHCQLTGSLRAQFILSNWQECRFKFLQVVPPAEIAEQEPATVIETEIKDRLADKETSFS